jgi:predicted phosphodiesterase
MRTALIADIHGNLTALDAVLADFVRRGADRVVCLGDVAATGPQPRETLRRVREVRCPVVMGNADAWLLHPRLDEDADEDARRFAEIDLWCRDQLDEDDLAFVRTFEPTIELSPGDGGPSLLCFHGSPRSWDEVIAATTPETEMEDMLRGVRAGVLAGGHTHVPLVRRHRGMLLINPGSVGLPYEIAPDTGEARNPAWAEYAVLDTGGGSLSIELRRVPVDAQAVVAAALASGMAHAAWWAQGWR